MSFQCTKCGAPETEVKDSRPTHVGMNPAIRRRRACTKCGFRFSTFETVQEKYNSFQKVAAAQSALSAALVAIERAQRIVGPGNKDSFDSNM